MRAFSLVVAVVAVACEGAVPPQVFGVKPETRYSIEYDWSVASGDFRDFDSDPDGPGKVFNYRGSEYPVQRLYFSGSGERRDEVLAGRNTLAPGRSGRMKYEFYTPSNASFLRLQVHPPKGTYQRRLRMTGLAQNPERKMMASSTGMGYSNSARDIPETGPLIVRRALSPAMRARTVTPSPVGKYPCWKSLNEVAESFQERSLTRNFRSISTDMGIFSGV